MYNAPHPLPHPVIAWPGHVLGLLSVSFLSWSVLVPWSIPSHPEWMNPILRGVQLPVGQFLLLAVGACILGWIALHILVGRPVLRWCIVVASLILLLTSVLAGINWNDTHAGYAIPGLVWGGILGMAALALAGWSPVLVTSHNHPSKNARSGARRWSLPWRTLAALLLASVLILRISIHVARDLRRPVVIPPGPCACSWG